MTALNFFVLGPPRIELDGVSIRLAARKNIALLVYLAVTGESYTRESLITLLWPELEPTRARAGLRRNLSDLRKALGGEWLQVDREIVGLIESDGIWVDAAEFHRLISKGPTHDHAENEVCQDCLEDLGRAVDLYRGDFLEGFSLRDSALFDEWQFFQAEQYRQGLATALQKLVRGTINEVGFEKAIRYARRWIQLDPLHEPANQRLMELYAWTGQWTAALHQYQVFSDVLKKELNLPPSKKTTELYQVIKQKRRLDLPGDGVEQASHITKKYQKHNLPPQSTLFVGREEEIGEITRMLQDPNVRLVTVLGAGGMGKTRLALETAVSLLDQFSDGVYFIPLANAQSTDGITSSVAEALGLLFYDQSDPQKQLMDMLRSRKTLLILDGFEHLLEDTTWVNNVLTNTLDVKILITSQTKLNLQMENLFPISGMAYPTVDPLSEGFFDQEKHVLTQYSAVELFLQGARRVKPNFHPSNKELVLITQICQSVGGMPLAILLAANWIETLTIPEIIEEIKKDLDFLTVDLRDIPLHQRSLRAVFNHTWHMLTETEQLLIGKLSVFRGGFTRVSAKKIAGCSIQELRAFVNKSLLSHLSTGRFEMHEILRQFAHEELENSAQIFRDTHQQHGHFFADLIKHSEPGMHGAQPRMIFDEVEMEIGNINLAWNWWVEEWNFEKILYMIDGLFFFLLSRMRYREGDRICEKAEGKFREKTLGESLRAFIKILIWHGIFNWRMGFSEKSNQKLDKALSLLQDPTRENIDFRQEKASILLQKGHNNFDYNYEATLSFYQQSLSLYRSLGDQRGTADALSGLAFTKWSSGFYQDVKDIFLETLRIRLSLDDFRGVLDSMSGLGQAALFLGQFDEALRYMNTCRQMLKSKNGRIMITEEHFSPELDLIGFKDESQNTDMYQQNVGLYSDLGFSHSLAPSNSILGFLLKHLGRYEEAYNQAEEGLSLARSVGWQQEEGLTLEVLGEIELVQEEFSKAIKTLQESHRILCSTGQLEQYEVLAVLGITCLGLKQIDAAQQYILEAIYLAKQIPALFPLTTSLTGFALYFALTGDIERGVELYALATRYPRIANSHWFKGIAGDKISDLSRNLTQEKIKELQEKGEKRDFNKTIEELLYEFNRS